MSDSRVVPSFQQRSSSKGKYTVNEVEERTSVAATTLRQWERRYGFPNPERSSAGYRLYSDQDLHQIERMKSHISDGIPASRAAELVKEHQPTPATPQPLHRLGADLVKAFTDFDEAAADAVLAEAHALYPVETVMRDLLASSMSELGDMWHQGHITTTTEHLASSYVYGRLRNLFNLASTNQMGPVAIVACAPLDQHELGALMVAVALRRSGFRVYYLGANTPVDDLAEMAHLLRPACVLISASTVGSFEELTLKRKTLQGMPTLAVYGGSVFNDAPELAKALGGLYLPPDIDRAMEQLQNALSSQMEEER
jgi:DNA-binding transcriptional MerR regulator/methylmalonyl-CoA mutase cobalamin-binding subunit